MSWNESFIFQGARPAKFREYRGRFSTYWRHYLQKRRMFSIIRTNILSWTVKPYLARQVLMAFHWQWHEIKLDSIRMMSFCITWYQEPITNIQKVSGYSNKIPHWYHSGGTAKKYEKLSNLPLLPVSSNTHISWCRPVEFLRLCRFRATGLRYTKS